ncbi:Protoporphyrinogen oxidase [Wallemia mellicola]|nr:Protoporphyrinogen oxidase [Wallemia mellicola]
MTSKNVIAQSLKQPKSISIIGGGISGLSAAYYASKAFPATKVHLFEASDRLGGWINSERINLGNYGTALIESGPRTLRPNGVSGALVLDLIDKLGLESSLLSASKSSPAAKNRFIYHPDRLNQLPSSLASIPSALLKYKTLRAIPAAILNDIKTPAHKLEENEDESVDAFFRRRFGDKIADNIASAVIHGIYATDSRDLSLRTAFPLLYKLEQRAGSVVKGLLKGVGKDKKEEALELAILDGISPSLRATMQTASIFSFKNGISEIVQTLESALHKNNNVEIYKSSPVKAITQQPNKDFIIDTQNGLSLESSHLISSIPAKQLSLQKLKLSIPVLKSPDVAVVTLVYPQTELPITGFGYLIPRSTPRQKNPHGVLGVVLDSDAMPKQDPKPITKLTVMLGGPYGLKSFDDDHLKNMAIETAVNQLSDNLHTPIASKVSVARSCIPTYPPGYQSTLQELHDSLSTDYDSRFAVIGSSFTGISVGDCVRSGWETIESYKAFGKATGLERWKR